MIPVGDIKHEVPEPSELITRELISSVINNFVFSSFTGVLLVLLGSAPPVT
jgi:hypothetical protein